MPSSRVTVAGLMGVVAVAGVQAAAIKASTTGWLDGCRLLTVGVLVVATFLARGRTGEQGAFWFGFAVIGWAAFALVADIAGGASYEQSVFDWLPMRSFEAMSGWEAGFEAGYEAVRTERCRFHAVRLAQVLPVAFLGAAVCWFWERRRPRRAAGPV